MKTVILTVLGLLLLAALTAAGMYYYRAEPVHEGTTGAGAPAAASQAARGALTDDDIEAIFADGDDQELNQMISRFGRDLARAEAEVNSDVF